MIAAPVFRFEESDHSYWLGDDRIPSATQLIRLGGLLGPAADFYTEASRERGQIIHALCADHDLGVDLGEMLKTTPHRGHVMAYIAAVAALKPAWDAIEEATVSLKYRYGVRPDRVGLVFGRRSVVEIKSGAKAKHHACQSALQALAESEHVPLPPDQWQRLTIYLTHHGRYTVERHEDRRDFDQAMSLIRRFC